MAANSALAALVTQADDAALAALVTQADDAPKVEVVQVQMPARPAETAPAPGSPPGGGGWFFRCFKTKERKPRQANLSAVVPSGPSQAARTWEEPSTSQSQAMVPAEDQATPSASSDAPARPVLSEADKKLGSGHQKRAAASDQQSASSSREETSIAKAPDSSKGSSKSPRPGGVPQLPLQAGLCVGRKTLVLDLDETLVHSSFRTVNDAAIIIEVQIEGENHKVYVRKRPGVDEFLQRMAKLYEIVIYTASMAKYASPLLDQLDPFGVCHFRLYREACTRLSAGYAKDLSRLGRDLKNVIIIDNSAVCYSLQPDNAIPIQTWRDDVHDRELLDLIPILISLADVDDIPMVLRQIIWAADDEVIDDHG